MFKVTSLYNYHHKETISKSLTILKEKEYLTEESFTGYQLDPFCSEPGKRNTHYSFYRPIERYLLCRNPKIVKDLNKRAANLKKIMIDQSKLQEFLDLVAKAKNYVVVAVSNKAYSSTEDLLFMVEVEPAILLTCEDERLRDLGFHMLGKPKEKNPIDIALGKVRGTNGSAQSAYSDFYAYNKVASLIKAMEADPGAANQSKHPYIQALLEKLKSS
jgi:hypothetical protein